MSRQSEEFGFMGGMRVERGKCRKDGQIEERKKMQKKKKKSVSKGQTKS